MALITAGLVILADAAMTLAWKEPVSAVYSSLRQGEAADQLATLEEEFAAEQGIELVEPLSPREAKRRARRFARHVTAGEGIGRIGIESIDAEYVFVEGTAKADLEKGPGRYENRAFPGEGATVGIAGHRTTYGAPFRQIDRVSRGDEVVLEMPYGTFTYEVTRTEIVEPTDVEIVDDVGSERLVLTACHPLYSAAQRYAVFARPTGIAPPADAG